MTTLTLRSCLLAGLALSPLVLAGCVSQSAYDELQAENQQLKQHIARLQGAIAYTVNSDLLFKPGSWQMTQRGQDIIAGFARKLAAHQQSRLVVNGYTDNTPIGPGLKQQGITTNQELSQKRAEAVMQYMIAQGVKADMISAKGWGEADPVASNDTAQGRAKNRRVEVTIPAQATSVSATSG